MKLNRVASFKRALIQQGDLWDFEDIVRMCQTGEMQSFADDDDNWVVTRICEFPKRRVLDIVAMIGDYDGIRRMEKDLIIPFAKKHGIDTLMASGRPGFLTRRPEGWKLVSATFVRTIEDGE